MARAVRAPLPDRSFQPEAGRVSFSDFAFAWLERAYDQRDAGIFWTKVDPLLQSLHADPRWLPFLRRLGLADVAPAE